MQQVFSLLGNIRVLTLYRVRSPFRSNYTYLSSDEKYTQAHFSSELK